MLPDSDERQVAPTIEGIRKDHSARYMWACPYVRNKSVIDYGCGVGYGSAIMATAAADVLGVDADGPAISYARAHYAATGARFECETVDSLPPSAGSAVAVAFEVIEHIEAPDKFLADVNADLLLASVPNEHVFPWVPGLKFHHRHYTPEQFEQLLNDCGWQVLEWWGQEGPESMPVANTQGRTQLVVAERKAAPKGGTWKVLPPPPDIRYVPSARWRHPTGKVPESVMLVALGNSNRDYFRLLAMHQYMPPWQETWTLNTGCRLVSRANVNFVLDDVYDYARQYPQYAEEMRNFPGPIIGQTTIQHDDIEPIPFERYPYEDVLKFWQEVNPARKAYLHLHTISIPLILAYAGMVGVKKLYIAGIDCHWANDPLLSERGQSVIEYWLSALEGIGCEIEYNESTTLNRTNEQGSYEFRPIYGLLAKPTFLM